MLVVFPLRLRGDTVVNGDFETKDLTGWSSVSTNFIEAAYTGGWLAHTGTFSPLTTNDFYPPPQGISAAICDERGPGSHVLYQDIELPPTAPLILAYRLFYTNLSEIFYTPNSLLNATSNQQLRVDILNPSATPYSVAPGDVLTNLFNTAPGSPLFLPPASMTADLTRFAGTTIRLRFALAATEFVFLAGVDEIAIQILAPVIVTQPTSQAVVSGEQVTFSVVAAGDAPLFYQWHKDGSVIPAATNTSLIFYDVQSTDDAFYSVVVTNLFGVTISSNAALTVISPLPVALDTPSLTWTGGGSATWIGQARTSHDGVDAGQSASISHGQQSWAETTVFGPGTLSFWWMVSSEFDYDFLEFRTNGTLVDRISGEIPWQQRTLSLGPGAQVLRWRYTKDSSLNGGKDLAWLDQVSFAPAQSLAVAADHSSLGFISNRFGFKISGAAGQVVVVEGSTNLLIWTPLVTNTMGTGPFSFIDPSAANFQRRFYRMRLQ